MATGKYAWKIGSSVAAFLLLAAACSGGSDSTDEAEDDAAAVSSETLDGDGDSATDTAEADSEESAEEPTIDEIVDIWQRADDSIFKPDDLSSRYIDVLEPGGDTGWTIVGSVRDHATSRSRAAVWEFDELVWNNWMRTDLPPMSAELDEGIAAIARFGDMRVVAGSQGAGPDRRAAIWVGQADGTWEPVEMPPTEAPDETGVQAAESAFLLRVSPNNDLIAAFGTRTETDGSDRAVIWTSRDAQNWTRIDPDQLDQDERARPTSIAVGPDGLVAVGSVEGEDLQASGRVWLSADGDTWTVVDPEALAAGYNVRANSVDRLDDRFVLVGSIRTTADDTSSPASWTSIDGETWEGPFTGWQLNDDGRAITGGFGARRVIGAGDRVLATATSDFMQHVWTSTDGQTWQTVDNIWDVRDAGVSINGLATDGQATVTVTDEPSLLFHESDWAEIRLDKNTTPSPTQKPYTTDIAWTPDGFVAVGGFQAKPGPLQFEIESGSWISADGETWDEYLPLARNEWGSIGSVAVVEGEPYATLTESVEHAIANNRFGWGMALRPDDTRWSVFYELTDNERRSAVTNIVQAGDELIVGGWQFSNDRTRTNARLGSVPLAEIGTDAETALDLQAPAVWNGAGHHVGDICANDDGTVLAVGDGRLESRGQYVLAASRSTDGVWTDQTAADDSFSGHEAQDAEVCVGGVTDALIGGWIFEDSAYDAAVWSADSSGQWQMVTSEQLGGDGDQWIVDGIRIGDRYLFIGSDNQGGSARSTVWVGSGSEWSAIPIGPDAWSMESVEIESDAASRTPADIAETKVVIAAWQFGRTVVYQTTMADIDEALATMAELTAE